MENDEEQTQPAQEPTQPQPEQPPQQEAPQTSEKDVLIAEKQRLAVEIGIWGKYNPIPDFESSPQYARIKTINQRLAEIG